MSENRTDKVTEFGKKVEKLGCAMTLMITIPILGVVFFGTTGLIFGAIIAVLGICGMIFGGNRSDAKPR